MLSKRNKPKLVNGDSLIEVMVVAFILVTSLTALASVVTASVARNRLAKERVVATRLAQEGLEWLMSERNKWGFNDVNRPGVYCLYTFPDDVTQLVGDSSDCQTNLNEKYKRTITIESAELDTVMVTATVTWGNSTVTQQGKLSKWAK